MTENERRIRLEVTGIMTSPNAVNVRHAESITKALDALLAEQRAALSAARNAALEEAAHLLDETERLARAAADVARAHVRPNTAFIGEMSHAADVLETQAQRIRALQSAPAQVVSKANVRDVLTDLRHGTGNDGGEEYDKACRDFANEAARRIGVDLDATEERPVPNCGYVNAHDGLCAHPSNTTPECHPSACPLIPATP